MTDEVGEPREAGMNILLFVVTGTAYWFIWLHNAVREFVRQRRVEFPTKQVYFLLAPLWAIGVAFWTLHLVLDDNVAKKDRFLDVIYYQSAWWIGGVVVLVAFFVLQAFYVRAVNELVRQANLSFGDDRAPPNWLAFPWNFLLACFWIPYVRFLAVFFGALLWIIWSYNFQEALNRYWLGHVSLPQDAPPGLKAPV